MNKIVQVLLGLTALALLASALEVSEKATNFDMIKEINSKQSAWVAGENEFFKDSTIGDVIALLGTRLNGAPKPQEWADNEPTDLPQSFDSRQQWPGCAAEIRNQAKCGSCWAFGCVEALSDRFCIAGKNISISALDLVTCDNSDNGCFGGFPMNAWEYARDYGLVDTPCRPYTIPTCAPEDQPCLNFVNTPVCNRTCSNDEDYENSLHYADRVYGVSSNADDIAQEIMNNGPVEAAFTVYADFVHYKSGVYSHQSGSALGGHAVKIIGWGVENGQDYWMVANSWTTTWGDNGFFKIAKGNDECGIEDMIVAGSVKM